MCDGGVRARWIFSAIIFAVAASSARCGTRAGRRGRCGEDRPRNIERRMRRKMDRDAVGRGCCAECGEERMSALGKAAVFGVLGLRRCGCGRWAMPRERRGQGGERIATPRSGFFSYSDCTEVRRHILMRRRVTSSGGMGCRSLRTSCRNINSCPSPSTGIMSSLYSRARPSYHGAEGETRC